MNKSLLGYPQVLAKPDQQRAAELLVKLGKEGQPTVLSSRVLELDVGLPTVGVREHCCEPFWSCSAHEEMGG